MDRQNEIAAAAKKRAFESAKPVGIIRGPTPGAETVVEGV